METKERAVSSYKTASGGLPFREWRAGFSDGKTRAIIDARVTRFSTGNFGDSKPAGDGVSESRIDHGPGLRIYYATDGDDVVLLCGGDKSTQAADISKAKKFWLDYKARSKS